MCVVRSIPHSTAGRRARAALLAVVVGTLVLGVFPTRAQVSNSMGLQMGSTQGVAGDVRKWLALDATFGLEGIWDSIDIEADIDPVIVASPQDGALTLIWAKRIGEKHAIALASRPLGGEWGAMSILQPNPGADRTRPGAVFDQAGNLHVIWQRAAGQGRVVEHTAKVFTWWTPTKPLSPVAEIQSAIVQFTQGSVRVTYWTRRELVQIQVTIIVSSGGSDDIDPTITVENEEVIHMFLPQ
jgi:hypothetical protein